MDIMCDDSDLGRRRGEATLIGQRAADVFQPALPMGAHRTQAELVILRMALMELGLIDQMNDVVGAMAGQRVDRVSLFGQAREGDYA